MGELANDGCVNPSLGQLLTSYCFGDISVGDFQRIEAHLLECEACWEEFQRFDAGVRTLRFDHMLRPPLPINEAVSMLGLSGRLNRPFGGHQRFVLWIAVLYGLVWAVGIWSELGYSYERYSGLVWALFLPTAIWVAAALTFALWCDAKATKAAQTSGLVRSATIVLLALGALVVCLVFVLPAEQTILASFQTRTASSGYFKDALQIFLPLMVFILPSFHTVLHLQRDLGLGRHRLVARLLTWHPERVWPRGVFYLSPPVLAVVLLILGVLKIQGANHMLDALSPGPYANLFSVASYISTGLWFAIALASLVWFQITLNELKRESQALALLDQHDGGSTKQ
jgi:hypothetical protein